VKKNWTTPKSGGRPESDEVGTRRREENCHDIYREMATARFIQKPRSTHSVEKKDILKLHRM